MKTRLFLRFVKTGVLNKQLGKLFGHLFDWRQETDYADFIDFDEATVKPLLISVQKLNIELKKLM